MALGINLGILSQETSTDFQNIYSLEFDGIDDYVNVGNVIDKDKSTAFSISLWVNIPSTITNNIIISKVEDRDNGGPLSLGGVGYQLYFNNQLYFRFLLDSQFAHWMYVKDANYWGLSDGLINGWHHIVGTYDGSGLSSGMTLYVDGYDVSAVRVDNGTGDFNNTGDLYVGGQNYNATPSISFRGKIDEPCIIPTELTPEEVIDIYNGTRPSGGGAVGGNWNDGTGKPKDMSSYNPDLWLRNGDNGSWKSPQWLLPNNENKDKVSNYTFEFDGVDDFVDLPSSVDLGINNTICAWVKRSDIDNLDSITGESSFSGQQNIYISGRQRVYMKIGSFTTFWYNISGFGILNQVDTWFHLAIVRSGNDATLYLNGSPTFVKSGWGTSITTKFDRIGAQSVTGNNPMFGNLDEIVAFDSALTDQQITDIYNGGTPTTISGAVAHWRMGEEATFSGGVWTVPDQVGGNDGTSNAMTIDARVGIAPSSSINSLSFNMDLIDRVTDVPT